MRRIRFSIAGLMVAIAVTSLAMFALRSASAVWAGAMLLLVSGVLGLAIVGALCRGGTERVWWLGFALFGCGYLGLGLWSENNFGRVATTTLLEYLSSKLDATVQLNVRSRAGDLTWAFFQVYHCLLCLLAAVLGGVLARCLFADSEHHREQPVADTQPGDSLPRRWWRRPAIMGSAGLALVGSAALAGSRSAPGLWAGVTFLMTCGTLGLAALGALLGRGGRREIWLGAALFGCGYMVFTFGRSADANGPFPPTTHLLNALRPGPTPHWSGFPDSLERFNAHNARVLKALEQPIPMHFPDGAPLEDILKYIKTETEARVRSPFPIYIDPVGLREARQTMQSIVRIDLEAAALKNSMRRFLKQLDLTFTVRDGFVMISDAGRVLPVYEDPFLIVGHCLLALIAAGIGSVLAPLVSDRRGRVFTGARHGLRLSIRLCVGSGVARSQRFPCLSRTCSSPRSRPDSRPVTGESLRHPRSTRTSRFL